MTTINPFRYYYANRLHNARQRAAARLERRRATCGRLEAPFGLCGTILGYEDDGAAIVEYDYRVKTDAEAAEIAAANRLLVQAFDLLPRLREAEAAERLRVALAS